MLVICENLTLFMVEMFLQFFSGAMYELENAQITKLYSYSLEVYFSRQLKTLVHNPVNAPTTPAKQCCSTHNFHYT